ncbi:MAG: DUF1957 domain-containing protein [Verrucomicrobiota bacterium]|nr:DUF1957 domain-containing protein [Verrucomicrobiota bacterium]
MNGSVALILHAHLPFVRHPEHDVFHEENWLFEAITESYIPLLRSWLRLQREGVPFKLTLSCTPTLSAMLADPFLRERYVRHLDRLNALAEIECERTRDDERRHGLAHFYRNFFAETRHVFVEEWNSDLLAVLRQLRGTGVLELIASAATHGILPIWQSASSAAATQIAVGIDEFSRHFGGNPRGFWLPECAYAPGLDQLLGAQEIRWFTVDAHALTLASPPAKFGTYAPCFTPAGPAVFARDIIASREVWSAEAGYPGHPHYRDFYRDIGFDLRASELDPFEKNTFTGIKYHRITGRDGAKEYYEPETAHALAREHAITFVERRLRQLDIVSADVPSPLLTIPFDAELFGHWWFEGPIFLEHVLREAHARGLPLTTPSDFLASNQTHQITRPAASSWGDKGFLDVWLDDRCGWIYPHLFAATRRMTALAKKHAQSVSADDERVLRQLARELLLAQSSDWPFLIRNGTATSYATQRVRSHLKRFAKIAGDFERGRVDRDFLAQCEERDNLFASVHWQHFLA